MARSASTYTPPTGHRYMDSPINPDTLKSGALEQRFNLSLTAYWRHSGYS